MQRAEFLAGLAAAGIASPGSSIDFTFPGHVAVVAQRVNSDRPQISYEGSERFSSASVIKLLIAVDATDKIAQTGASWSQHRVLTQAEIVPASETFGKVRPGEKATFAALLSAMISQSDNTAANALADYAGFPSLNERAAQLGLRRTKMERHFMDFKARAAGRDNFTSAADMTRLTRFIALHPHRYSHAIQAMLRQEDRELIPAAIARNVKIANKTGTLTDVRHDVAIVGYGSPSAYVLAILTSDFPSLDAAQVHIRRIAAQVDARMA